MYIYNNATKNNVMPFIHIMSLITFMSTCDVQILYIFRNKMGELRLGDDNAEKSNNSTNAEQ